MRQDMEATAALVSDLKREVRGEVRMDSLTRQLYATDASSYCKTPVGVVFPRDRDDVQAAVTIADRHGVAVIPRGGGSNLSGQTVGTGLIIDMSRHMNAIAEINPEERWARVESGAILDALNGAAAQHSLMVGPDPSSSMVATLGGMAGNNSTGAHSCRYGMIGDHIQAMDVILADGSAARLAAKDADAVAHLADRNGIEGGLYKSIPAILAEYDADIKTGYPHTWRNVAGYRLHRMRDAAIGGMPFNLAPLIAGSEGSLALITDITVGLVDRPTAVNLMVLHFSEVGQALDMVPAILEKGPSAIELMTSPSILLADGHPGFRPQLRKFVQGNPAAILIVEFAETTVAAVSANVAAFTAWLSSTGHSEPTTHCATPAQVANVWQVRKSILGFLLSRPGKKPNWIIDDATVPVDRLAAYVRDVTAAGRQFGIDINFDAHASAGCLHMGLDIDLTSVEGLALLERLSKQIMDVAIGHNGTTTGEHGEGLARSYFNERLYGPRLHQAFEDVKNAFDPNRRLNPHKILNPIEPWDTGWLRFSPDYITPLAPKQTHLDFGDYGGFAGLVEMCNGMGVCRSMSVGTMCPSYRVTGDETHSTRGRANALRAAITGRLGPDGLTDPELHFAMGLCLECKACRNECGSKVDMAKLKYEFLAHYQAAHGVPIRSRLFAALGRAGAIGSQTPRLANALYSSPAVRKLLDTAVGIDRRRQLPLLADRTFDNWWAWEHTAIQPGRREVILWNDCHIRFHEPEIGQAAVAVLEAAGCDVRVIENARCCGRPMISKGLLAKAKAYARHNIDLLAAHARAGTPIIGVEPSCIACFRDEYPSLLRTKAATAVADQSFFFEEFIMTLAEAGDLALPLDASRGPQRIKVHTHCYQKAFGTADKVVGMLNLIPGAEVETIASGCCGMAGSFGYEKEHYEISMAIGEQALFPAVRTATGNTVIAAAGTSCRQQIKDGTPRHADHPIVILAKALNMP